MPVHDRRASEIVARRPSSRTRVERRGASATPDTRARVGLGDIAAASGSTQLDALELTLTEAHGRIAGAMDDVHGAREAPRVSSPVQLRGGADVSGAVAQAAAARGVRGAGTAMPHAERIQAAFGRHDVLGIRAHVGGAARAASETMGAEAFATGSDVAFRRAPDLHTAAHEAAHIVQQRGGLSLAGGVGRDGDAHERHADSVADAVVAGGSAEKLLDRYGGPASATTRTSGVQRAGDPKLLGQYRAKRATVVKRLNELQARQKPLAGPVRNALSRLDTFDRMAFDLPIKIEVMHQLERALCSQIKTDGIAVVGAESKAPKGGAVQVALVRSILENITDPGNMHMLQVGENCAGAVAEFVMVNSRPDRYARFLVDLQTQGHSFMDGGTFESPIYRATVNPRNGAAASSDRLASDLFQNAATKRFGEEDGDGDSTTMTQLTEIGMVQLFSLVMGKSVKFAVVSSKMVEEQGYFRQVGTTFKTWLQGCLRYSGPEAVIKRWTSASKKNPVVYSTCDNGQGHCETAIGFDAKSRRVLVYNPAEGGEGTWHGAASAARHVLFCQA